MATKAAAMPQPVRMNCRRLKPSLLPFTSASSLIRASTFFCVALCGGGRYSPFDTIWVGIGVAADAASAPATRRCSRSLSQLLIAFLPDGADLDQCWLRSFGRAPGHFRSAKIDALGYGVLSASRDANRKIAWEFDRTGGTRLNAQTDIIASDVIRQARCPNASSLWLRAERAMESECAKVCCADKPDAERDRLQSR